MSSAQSVSLNNKEKSRVFLDGSERWVVEIPSMFVGKGVYKPGWRWSKHAGAQTGKPSESHIGLIESGKMVISDSMGAELIVGPGDMFEMGPNHDAWVLGDEPCVALDFEIKKD